MFQPFLRIAGGVAFAALVSACSSSPGTTLGALGDQRLVPASQSLSLEKSRHIHAGSPASSTTRSGRQHAPPPGCTPISSVNPSTIFVNFTAASFTPGNHVTIDGTGCNVALYLGPGTKGGHLDHADFPGTPCDYMILTENTTVMIDHTTIAPPGLGCFGNGYGIPTGIGYTNSTVIQDHTTISNISGQAILVGGGNVTIDHTTVNNSAPIAGGDGIDNWDTSKLTVGHMAVTGAGYYYSTGFYFANSGMVRLMGDAATNWENGYWSDCTSSILNTNFFKGESVSNDVVNFTIDNSMSTCTFVKSLSIPYIMGA